MLEIWNAGFQVRGLIESMIAKLTKEAAEEADLKSFCDAETSESKAKQAELTAKLDKTNAAMFVLPQG